MITIFKGVFFYKIYDLLISNMLLLSLAFINQNFLYTFTYLKNQNLKINVIKLYYKSINDYYLLI